MTPPPGLPEPEEVPLDAQYELPPLTLDDLLGLPDHVPSWHEFLNADPGDISVRLFDVMLSRDLDADEYLAFLDEQLDE